MRILVLAVILVMEISCSHVMRLREPARAWISEVENHEWRCDVQGCTLMGHVENIGTGCATRVRGSVRLVNEAGAVVGTPLNWELPVHQVLVPQDRVAWQISFVPVDVAKETAKILSAPDWIDTACKLFLDPRRPPRK